MKPSRDFQKSQKKITKPPPVIRRYTSPCGVSFEAPTDAVEDRILPSCSICGSHEWVTTDRRWGLGAND